MKRKISKKAARKNKGDSSLKVKEPENRFRINQDWLYGSGLLILSLIAFWSMTIDGRKYTQGDNINDAIFYNQVNTYYQQTGEEARWNPFIFGGVPNIFNLPKSPWTVDYYIDLLSSVLSLPFVFFGIGALGLYFFLRYLKFDRLQSFFGSLIFLLSPFYKSLVINGHGTKIQAIMYAPWIFLALFRILNRTKWFDVALLVLFAGLQVRTSHYQVVFYTAVLSFVFVVWHLIEDIRAQAGLPWKKILLIGVAGIGTLLMSARPILLAANYAGDSIRGRDVVRLSDTASDTKQLESGVSKSFVETWSFSPSELMTLLVSRAMGGTSSEYFAKARSIGFRQDVIPSYWGHSPYNGSYYYLGAFVFFLLLVSFIWVKDNPLVWQFGLGLLLMLVWSLGTFAGPIYDLSYSFVPFFSNFRTPTTSMAMFYLLAAILAAYGLRSLPYFQKKELKKLYIVLGIGAVTIVLFFLIGSSMSFINERQNHQQNVLDLLTEARRNMFFSDLVILLISLFLFSGIIWLFVRKKIELSTTIIALLIFSTIDLLLVWTRYSDRPVSQAEFNRTYLGDSQTSSFLENDSETFRVFALSNQNYGLPAHVQTIGGGYDMQMNKSFYELTNNNLYQKIDGENQINWNVLDFMNVKYIVTDRVLEDEHLSQDLVDPAKGLYTYRYKFNKQRGFFVDEYQVVKDPIARMKMINSPVFDARRTAILEEYPTEKIFPASRSKVDLISFDPNKIVYTVETNNPGLFVMSDIFQPEMQEVLMDGDKVKDVFKTNHTIQSVIVPEGLHTIEIRYKKELFSLSQWISNISFVLIYFLIGGILYRQNKASGVQERNSA